jgi:hypothetical protein
MSEVKFLSRKEIKENQSIGEPFEVKQWGGYVNIKKWSGRLRAQLLAKVTEIYGGKEFNDDENENDENTTEAVKVGGIKIKSKQIPGIYDLMNEVVMMSVCDENGILFWDVNKPDDIAEVDELDGEVLQLLFDESANRNGLTQKTIKQEIKN